MIRVNFHVLIKLIQPLSQLSETIGNQTNLRVGKVVDLEGNTSEVFVLSGNSLRNRILRRCGVDSLLRHIGVRVSPLMHHTLFCGGAIDGGTGNDLDLDRKVRALLPCLSVLGTAKPKGLFGGSDAQMISGRISVGEGYLVCYETAEMVYRQFPPALPVEVVEQVRQLLQAKEHNHLCQVNQWLGLPSEPINEESINQSISFLVDRLKYSTEWLMYSQRVRNDSLHDPKLLSHLAEQPAPSKDDKDGKKRPSQQMLVSDWLVQSGALLYSYWSANISTIEEGFIVDALSRFGQSPYLGGQNGVGRGLCSLEIFYEAGGERGAFMTISPTGQVVSERAKGSHAKYLDFLSESKDEIRRFLNG